MSPSEYLLVILAWLLSSWDQALHCLGTWSKASQRYLFS